MSRVVAIPFVRSSTVRQVRTAAQAGPSPTAQAGDDLRLFATTFAAGFLFVSLFLA